MVEGFTTKQESSQKESRSLRRGPTSLSSHQMASTLQPASVTVQNPSSSLPHNTSGPSRGRGPRRRGRGRGGFGRGFDTSSSPAPRQVESSNQLRSQTLIRRGPEEESTQNEHTANNAADGRNTPLPSRQDSGRYTEEAVQNDIEAEVCFICASPVVHNAVAPCNHRTCHICALRLRALYKTRTCAHCRVSRPYRCVVHG